MRRPARPRCADIPAVGKETCAASGGSNIFPGAPSCRRSCAQIENAGLLAAGNAPGRMAIVARILFEVDHLRHLGDRQQDLAVRVAVISRLHSCTRLVDHVDDLHVADAPRFSIRQLGETNGATTWPARLCEQFERTLPGNDLACASVVAVRPQARGPNDFSTKPPYARRPRKFAGHHRRLMAVSHDFLDEHRPVPRDRSTWR